MTKKFALLFALLVMPAFGFAQDGAAPPAPVPVPESAAAVVVGQGCTDCGTQVAGCNSCGTASSCDPCARPARVRVFTRRNACCQPVETCCTPAPVRCCTPAPVPCCTPAPAPCCNTAVANDCCAPATRTRLLARRSNCCETATACATIATASTDCGCSSVATVAAPATVAQVSYVSECNGASARPVLRPFAGTVLRRTR